jgi:hypothetical protein
LRTVSVAAAFLGKKMNEAKRWWRRERRRGGAQAPSRLRLEEISHHDSRVRVLGRKRVGSGLPGIGGPTRFRIMPSDIGLKPAFENWIVTKKKHWILAILSNFAKFGIIRLNFDWMRFCIVKNRKTKNRPNLLINRTELLKFYLIHPKFGGIVEVIEV